MQLLSSLLFLLTPISLALPLDSISAVSPVTDVELDTRACATTCGSTCYTAAQLTAARNAACSYVKSGGKAGGSTYPHVYNNYEGFNFASASPWYEFPVKASGTYTGGSPGADRIVINKSCARAGEITHTGASGNNFVGCTGTST
ncbi:ribonuclease-domain-containing protein [Amniculicola lignicola CBS 123094]|uniref:ribonuclease T1 n=1 Tax=Amniculicola lignicola CBS 123094 TaxID=1392246 RepID=A0A6A5WEF6_9PLEO|nr:ribonuclease-domain-containing protein [Amniculicola lignicola CBS 123094]